MPVPLPEKIQTAVVSGAASGVGAVIARALHKAGYRVVIADIDEEAASLLAAELDLASETAVTAKLDIRHPQDFQILLDKVIERWGSAEVLVNNAALTRAQPLLDIDPVEFNDIVAANVGSVFASSQIFGRHFKARNYGRIINIGSLAGQNGGTATGAHYAASKGAILTLTKVFARELAGFGVTVNAIAPGPLDSPAVHRIVSQEALPALVSGIPVKRLGDAPFIAEMAVLLASPSAASVTGACWDANGGLFMR